MTDASPIHVPSPCSAQWTDMKGDERERLCAQCDTAVHNISDMTLAQVEDLLEHNTSPCIRYRPDEDGAPLLRDSKDPQWRMEVQWRGAQRMVQAALTSVPLLMLAACDTTPTPAPSPRAQPPSMLVVEGNQVYMSPYAKRRLAQLQMQTARLDAQAARRSTVVEAQLARKRRVPKTEDEPWIDLDLDVDFDFDFTFGLAEKYARVTDVAGISSGIRSDRERK